jgi:hypothetical protein
MLDSLGAGVNFHCTSQLAEPADGSRSGRHTHYRQVSAMATFYGELGNSGHAIQGPAIAPGVKGTFGTIKRVGGPVQATYHGHPPYTFVGDAAPRQAKGNGLNAFGGLWHEVTTSHTHTATHTGGSSSGSGGGYGY